jgi:hypothetical protein
MRPWKSSPQTLFPPRRSGLLDNLDRPGLWAGRDLGAIVPRDRDVGQ